MPHEPALSLSSLQNFFARLFTWPFFVGLGTGIVLVLGGLGLFSFIMMQQVKDRARGASGAPVSAPNISERAARSVHGTVPADWTLRPVSADAGPTSFGDATGEKTVVNLWATWCGPCINEMPTLEALHTSTGDSVSVVLVSEEKRTTIRQFLEDKDYDMPVYVASELPAVFEGTAIPRTFVVDAAGRVRYRHVGAADWNADAVHRLLRQLPEATAAPS
jgi:thiol-disulfide isomerase/thioredoxin